MKIEIEIDVQAYGLLCKRQDVKPLLTALRGLDQRIWTESFYDAQSEATREFALSLVNLMREVKRIIPLDRSRQKGA